MKRNRKAKILATLGPSSNTADIIEKIFSVGADVFRLNFSHGTIEEHRKNFDIIRSLENLSLPSKVCLSFFSSAYPERCFGTR